MGTGNPSQHEGRVWVQMDELDAFHLAACNGLNSLTDPRGTPVFIREQDPINRRGSVIADVYEGEIPGTTFTIATKQLVKNNWWKSIKCPINIQLHQGKCSRPDVYSSSPYGWSIGGCRRGTATVNTLAVYDNAGDDTVVGVDIPFSSERFPSMVDWEATFTRTMPASLTISTGLNDVATLAGQCGDCGTKTDDNTIYWVVGDVAAGSPGGQAEVFYTEDAGATFTGTSADPFVALEDVSCVVLFGNPSNYRVVVGRGSSDVWNPAEVAISDDKGVSWTNVNVGAVNGEYINEMWNIGSRIWAVGGKAGVGKVWYSADGGGSWTILYSGAQPMNDIMVLRNGAGVACGNTNIILLTDDAGTAGSWAALTGPATWGAVNVNTCAIKPSTETLFVGGSNGTVFASTNDGVTWTSITPAGVTATAIKKIRFFEQDDQFGGMVCSIAGPSARVLRTSDGGASWGYATVLNANITANVGLNNMVVVDANVMIVVGEAVTSIGYVAETNTAIDAEPS